MNITSAIEKFGKIVKKASQTFGVLTAMTIGTVSAHSLHVIDDTYADSANPDAVLDDGVSERKRLLVASLENEFNGIPAGERIAYFRHEVDTLPITVGSENIDKASIRIWVSEVIREGVLLIHTIDKDWDERTLTYNTRPDISGDPDVSGIVAAVNITQADANHWLTIDISKVFEGWRTFPETNFGLAITTISAPETQSAIVVFSSKEGIYVDTETTENNVLTTNTDNRCDTKSGTKCDAQLQCEKQKRKACKKYKDYSNKSKYLYKQVLKFKKLCYKSKKYCAKYQELKKQYQKACDKAAKYKKLCKNTDCDNECPEPCDDDNGNGNGDGNPTTVSIDGTSGHPSEIEVAIKAGGFDLVSRQAFAAGNLDDQKFIAPRQNTAIETELDLNVASNVMYMATLSLNWTQKGNHLISCEAILYTDNGGTIATPNLTKTVSNNMTADIITINASSFGEALIGLVRAEVFCEMTDENGGMVEHTSNGNISAWAVPASR